MAFVTWSRNLSSSVVVMYSCRLWKHPYEHRNFSKPNSFRQVRTGGILPGGGTQVGYPPSPRPGQEGGGYSAGGGGTQLGQQKEYSLHGGRYASCVHAGGLSCRGWVQREPSDANAMFLIILFLQKTKPLTPDMMQKVLKSAIQLVLFCPHKYVHVKLQEKLTVGKCYF